MSPISEEDIRRHEIAVEKSRNSRNPQLEFFGDRSTLISIVTLLSYIRNAIKNGKQSTITVNVGKNIMGKDFDFLMNGEKIDDLIIKNTIDIN